MAFYMLYIKGKGVTNGTRVAAKDEGFTPQPQKGHPRQHFCGK
jgi:hypothetical protein